MTDQEFDHCRWCRRAIAIDDDFCSEQCEDEYDAEWEAIAREVSDLNWWPDGTEPS